MPDGFFDWIGDLFNLIATNVVCMVGVIVFGVILAIIIVVWYIRKVLGQEIFVHGRKDKD
ncbi:MAG: hypothetical protein ACE5IO_09610 [Thermoplasmata archaeon]